jgi:hypothetical protein
MPLAPTYYDFIKKIRPLLFESAERDAAELSALGTPPSVIRSVDEYQSRYAHVINHFNASFLGYNADNVTLSAEQLSHFLSFMTPHEIAEYNSVFTSMNYEYHCLVNFALAGKKAFHFADNLTEHLANTEVNLKSALIQLPFSSCMFTFTSRSAINALHNIRGNAGRWDVNVTGLDYSAPVSVFLTMLPPDDNLPGRKLVICTWHARMPAKCYVMLKRELYLHDEWTLEQSLRTDWKNLIPDMEHIGKSVSSDDGTLEPINDNLFYTDGLAFYRIVLNAMLYLSSEKAELSGQKSPHTEIEETAEQAISPKKKRKILQAKGRYTALSYEEAGASVGTIIVRKDDTESPIAGDGSKKPLVRFMVRGHWRRQPHGPDSQDRKLIWILPHYKGPDLATTINKPYIVR